MGQHAQFCFFVQVVTGLVLWAAYSPSRQTAWESVYYIQHEMTAGWLLRGVHHFTAHAMVVLLAIHFVQVVIDGAYRAPREINFWIGLILMQIVLALALTGYLLPWDQKGYWATKVATNMMALVPVVGELAATAGRRRQRIRPSHADAVLRTARRRAARAARRVSGDARRPVPPARPQGARAVPAAGHDLLARPDAARRVPPAWP